MSAGEMPPPIGEWKLVAGLPTTREERGYRLGDALPWPPEPPGLGWDVQSVSQYLHALGERQKRFERLVEARLDSLMQGMTGINTALDEVETLLGLPQS